ncbi:capsid maturation protease [Salmonella phage STM1 BHU]|nr:capsid maturation protease [Salmonella phage STM1 BHU]
MTHDQIVAMVGKYNIKADRAVSYNFDKYGSTQVEIREIDGGSLIWRAWSYESNFENVLESALDHSGTLKTADEIAEQEAAARAQKLRNDAIFFEVHGFEDEFILNLSDFTREEIEAEIVAMNAELNAATFDAADHVLRSTNPAGEYVYLKRGYWMLDLDDAKIYNARPDVHMVSLYDTPIEYVTLEQARKDDPESDFIKQLKAGYVTSPADYVDRACAAVERGNVNASGIVLHTLRDKIDGEFYEITTRISPAEYQLFRVRVVVSCCIDGAFHNVIELDRDVSTVEHVRDVVRVGCMKQYIKQARATYAATGAATLNNDKTAIRVKIKTVAGMTLIAKTEDIIFSDSGLFCAAWLMRLDLLENKTYAQAVLTSQIKTIEFIK